MWTHYLGLSWCQNYGRATGTFIAATWRWWRKESKLDPTALDPGGLCAKFSCNDLMTWATLFPLAELLPSFGSGSSDQARALLRPIPGLPAPG